MNYVKLSYLCVFFLMLQGCNISSEPAEAEMQSAKDSAAAQVSKYANQGSSTQLPICEIDKIQSCEIADDKENETIYHCPHCSTGVPSPDCEAHSCSDCCEKNCQCRVEKKK